MEIIDYSKEYNTPPGVCGKHSIIFPKNIFYVVAGATGSGKTNLMVNLLKKEQTLSYSDVYVYSSTLFQP
jgi:ABC-type lipoprotein export system ATPase subunit